MATHYSFSTRPPLCNAPQPKITRNYLEEDYLAVWDDPGGSSSSDSESDSEMDSATKPKSRPQPTPAEKPRAKPTNARSGLKIVIPARNYNTGLVAKHALSDELDDPDEDEEDQDMHYTNDAEDEDMDYTGDEEDVDMNYEGDAEGEDGNMSYECGSQGEPSTSRTKIRKVEYCSARSPLSASSKVPVYTGFYCTIENCRFTASSAQHLRHHIATAQHGRNLRAAYMGPA